MKTKKSKPYKVVTGDVIEWARSYTGPKFHALLCDPPYEIAFMGKSWDNSGIVFSPKTWKLLKRHLHPGAFCFAFSSTRTLHRMMVAIEDAGFVIHPFMALWNFACVSDDTDILTLNGWKSIDTISKHDKVFEWVESKAALIPRTPKRVFKYGVRCQEMLHLHSSMTDQLVTPNHTVIYKSRTNPRYTYTEKYIRKAASEINPGHLIKVPLTGTYNCGKSPKWITPDVAYLLGWYFTDAWLHKDAYAVCFSQAKPRTLALLKEALTRFHSTHQFEVMSTYVKKRKRPHNDEITFYCRGQLASKLRDEFPEREFSYEVLSWSYDCRKRLFDGLLDGDGSYFSKTYVVFWSLKQTRLDVFAALAVSLGYAVNINKTKGCVGVKLDRCETEFQRTTDKHGIERTTYTGRVWCVETASGAFVARRNGKSFITGNSGMPKATNPSYALDKMQGAERKLLHSFSREGRSGGILGKKKKIVRNVTESATVVRQQWQGHRYGRQALKPAFEPVICFQKPYPKKMKPVLSMLGTGAGALNIDGCRIGYESGGSLATNPSLRKTINGGNGGHVFAHEERRRVVVPNQDGRWPSNLILSHLPECRCVGEDVINKDKKCNRDRSKEPSRKTTKNNIGFGFKPGQRRGGEETVAKWECAEGCPVRELDKQTGTGKTSNSRYYFQAGWAYEAEERIAGAVPLRYVAKPSKREKDAGLNTPVKIADAYAAHRGRRSDKSSTRVDGGKLALARNTHPTPKPLALAEYLAKLLKCPKGYKSRLLVPFSGSGSEMIGGVLAGWHRVVGIEREKEYATIAKQRLRYWRSRKLDAKQAEGVVVGQPNAVKVKHKKLKKEYGL